MKHSLLKPAGGAAAPPAGDHIVRWITLIEGVEQLWHPTATSWLKFDIDVAPFDGPAIAPFDLFATQGSIEGH